MAMDFSWLPPGQDPNRLPLGMRVNNPGNIKYNPRLGYGGMLGPSAHTDQGDPQMTFDTPQNGMAAAASLARTKYQRGQTTPMSLIAGQGGWTPGNTQAAANVARTMGIGPNDDLQLGDPERLTKFLKALTLQEHGAASTLYGDDVYSGATGGSKGGASVPYMTQALNAAGTVPGTAPIAQPVAGTAGTVGALADFGALPSERRKAMADALLSQSFRTANAATNPLGAIAAMAQAGAGSYLGGRYDDEKVARNRKLAEALAGAPDNNALARTLLASGDDDLVRAAVSMKVAAAKQPTATEWERRAIAGGLKPGTPEYNSFILNGPTKQKGEEFGTTPQAWQDADGNMHYAQLSKGGGRKDVELPPGAKWMPGVEMKDTGTAFVPASKKTGEIVGPAIPKDVAGKERLEEIGKGQGQAQVDLPRVESNSDSMLAQIESVRNDPYLPSMTGPVDSYLPNLSGNAANVQAKINQLGGQAFLQAFQSLKGGGAITEVEGAKATAALSRLQSMGVDDKDYIAALDDFKDQVTRLRDLARQRAAGGVPAPPATEAASPAASSGGYRVLKVH